MRIRLSAAVLIAVAALFTGCSSEPSVPAPSPTVPGATPAGGSTSVPSTATAAPTFAAGALVPMWPFTTEAQVRTWQAAYRTSGGQPWHLDPGATALAFTRDHLSYREIDRVTTQRVDGGDARIGVGWSDPETGGPRTVAVLHLIRFGVGADAPWVVVGSDDTPYLTLTTPRYGSGVTSPLAVGGRITGVDESLRVVVLGPVSSRPLGVVQGIPAGGTDTPWTARLTVTAPPSGTVLTVAVATGGHIKDVERFAVTAVRVR